MNIPKEIFRLDFDGFVDYLVKTFDNNEKIEEGLSMYYHRKELKHKRKMKEIDSHIESLLEMRDTGEVNVEEIFKAEKMLEEKRYKVFIELKPHVDSKEFFKEKLKGHELLSIRRSTISVLWNYHEGMEPEDIDIRMYHALEDGKLGRYTVSSV